MRNHFFYLLVLASLLAFVQKFSEGENLFSPLLQRAPAQTALREMTVSVEEIPPEIQETQNELGSQ
jgi:hypothetical protein